MIAEAQLAPFIEFCAFLNDRFNESSSTQSVRKVIKKSLFIRSIEIKNNASLSFLTLINKGNNSLHFDNHFDNYLDKIMPFRDNNLICH